MYIPKKLLLILLLVITSISCSNSSQPPKVSDRVMPITQLEELTELETVLMINDLNHPPKNAPDFLIKTLKESPVLGAANLTYTWGNPKDLALIDTNVVLFTSRESALETVHNGYEKNNKDFAEIPGIGEIAIFYKDQSITFVMGNCKVTLATVHPKVDLLMVAKAYATWLEATISVASNGS